MPSLFSRIIAGDLPSHRLYEDERSFAFLDIRPAAPGHTLIIPKAEVDHLFDLEADDYAAVWITAARLAPVLKEVTAAERVGVLVAGFEVPHAHVHLIPARTIADIRLGSQPAEQEDLAAMADRIRAML